MLMPLARVKFQIAPLVNEILDRLPPDTWTDPSKTFLDPAIGGGQFLVEIERRLRDAGHSDENIAERTWGCEIRNIRLLYAKNWHKVISNHLIKSDCLSYDWGDMKFDVIVGNPPYQDTMPNGDRKSISTNLWSKFIDTSANDLLADNGWLAMIVPASWAGPTKNLSNNRRILRDIFAANNTTVLNLDPALNTYFGKVGSTFSWFVMQKRCNQGQTRICLDAAQSITMDLDQVDSLPRINNPLAYSINQKYFARAGKDVIQGQYRESEDQYQEKKTRQYKWPAYHTPADGGRTWWMKNKHPNFDKPKVMISLSGKYQPKPDTGTQGYTDMCLAYILKPKEKLDSAMSVIDSRFFHFIMAANKWSGFNNKQIIRTFALPKLNKVYSDKEIYEWFDLTKDEAEFVTNWYKNNYR